MNPSMPTVTLLREHFVQGALRPPAAATQALGWPHSLTYFTRPASRTGQAEGLAEHCPALAQRVLQCPPQWRYVGYVGNTPSAQEPHCLTSLEQ